MSELDKHVVENRLWERAGYKERQKLIFNENDEIIRIRDGVYSYKGIIFTYDLFGYKNFTILD